MSFFSAIFSCFAPSSRVSSDDVAGGDYKKAKGQSKHISRKSKSRGAPIVVSYFPLGSNLSRL
ncbi:hypothetical protein SLEP1_g39112 [Rubroshorea leprosula]|uniref:Secreted protein n=1 Tax=Rubroshorea leprosula TaxID=152421 RepID=A0AAV5KZT3_9ROSI|nr:hypothetical protein SLEP1_g39112 [Rubroshorea leprosula]